MAERSARNARIASVVAATVLNHSSLPLYMLIRIAGYCTRMWDKLRILSMGSGLCKATRALSHPEQYHCTPFLTYPPRDPEKLRHTEGRGR